MAIITANLGKQITLTATVKKADGTVMSLAGCALAWTLHQPGDYAGSLTPVITLTWTDGGASDGIAVSDVTTGVAVITLSAARSTSLLATNRRYPFDLAVTDGSSVTTPVNDGAIDVVPVVSDVLANYCTIDDVKARIDRTDALDDTQLQAIVTAASRAIDGAANRRFYQLTETRTYTAADNMRLLIDDLVALTSLKTDIAGTRVWDTVWATTDYDLLPDNAAGINWPYTEIRPRPFTSRWFPTLRKGVQIVGTWGWPVVPDAIVEATILQASRLFVRKSSPYGVAGMGNFGQVVVPKLDPDVQMLVQPYARVSIGGV